MTESWSSIARLAGWGWLSTLAACLCLVPLVSDGDFLFAGAVGGAIVALVGGAGRLLHLPVPAVCALQLFALLEWATLAYASSQAWGLLVPTAESMTALVDLVQAALTTSNDFAPPAPANRGIDASLAMLVAAIVLVVDLVAVGLRRPALAGLVFLGVYMTPVSLLAGEVPVLAFVPGALGFVFLLGAEQRDRVRHWGRQISTVGSLLTVRERQVTVSTLIQSGRRVGLGAVALAVVLPILVPTFPRTFLADGPLTADGDIRGGSDGSGTVEVVNPILDMRRNLEAQSEQVLVTLRTNGAAPSYLRIAAMDEFTGTVWQPSDRPDDESTPVDRVEAPPGLLSSVDRARVTADVQISESFATSWLPTLYPVTTMEAEGSWGVDTDHLDVSPRDEGENAAGLGYRFTSTLVLPTAGELLAAPEPDEQMGEYLELPEGMPPVIGELAADVTADMESDFGRARVLQDWFRTEGDFTYSLDTAAGDGLATIERFLTSERIGYCEQFAAAMALMARELGIPSRIAVGFLRPRAGPDGTWEYRGVDMHAWPELYFETIGWVRFEPTPGDRTGAAPTFQEQLGGGPTRSSTEPAQTTRSLRPDTAPTPAAGANGAAGGSGGGGTGLLLALVGIPVAGLLLVGPRAVRASVRTRRWRRAGPGRTPSAAEVAWRELGDLAVDLGVRVDHTATLRTSGRALRSLVDDDQPAVAALNRLVLEVERSRFARGTGHPGRGVDAVRGDVDEVHRRLAAGRSRGQRWRATWLPASLLPRRGAGGGRSAGGPLRARLAGRGGGLLLGTEDPPRP